MDIISELQEQVNSIAAITFGTLQRDAPPLQLSPNYPSDLVKAAKQFDALVAALPTEEAQLQRIAQLQLENDVIGQQLQKQLEAAEKELKQVHELFGQAADNCLNLNELPS